jgi:Secretion system C-terminal sorting domain
VTDALGCTSAPSVPVPIISTAVDARATDAFAVFPNPTGGAITLSFATDGAHVLLFCDAQGRVLRSERVSGASATLSLEDLPRGLYLLREAGSENAVRVVME